MHNRFWALASACLAAPALAGTYQKMVDSQFDEITQEKAHECQHKIPLFFAKTKEYMGHACDHCLSCIGDLEGKYHGSYLKTAKENEENYINAVGSNSCLKSCQYTHEDTKTKEKTFFSWVDCCMDHDIVTPDGDIWRHANKLSFDLARNIVYGTPVPEEDFNQPTCCQRFWILWMVLSICVTVAIIVLIIILIYCCCKKCKRNKKRKNMVKHSDGGEDYGEEYGDAFIPNMYTGRVVQGHSEALSRKISRQDTKDSEML